MALCVPSFVAFHGMTCFAHPFSLGSPALLGVNPKHRVAFSILVIYIESTLEGLIHTPVSS